MITDDLKKSGELILAWRVEELLADIDEIESKLNRTPRGEVDPLVVARALAALEAARRPLIIFLAGEGEEVTPLI